MKLAGWIMTGLLVAFLLVASVAPKLVESSAAVNALAAIGWPEGWLTIIGLLELLCVLLFALPRTGPLGAVLLTGLLGGTIASHLRAGSPLWSHTMFGVYLGLFAWLALYLRDPALRAFVRGYMGSRRATGGWPRG